MKPTLLLIVLSQFAGTSLWFAGNAILPELTTELDLSTYAVSHVTSAVMLGFITGTLVFALFTLADRYSPVKLFFTSSLLGALANAGVAWWATDGFSLFLFRFATGFFIAGIYPVGMKIASDWYEKGLGRALGYLLGALILGTAFPHLLKNREFDLPWKSVLYCTSGFAVIGGIIMLLNGDGPHRKRSGGFRWNAIGLIFHSRPWRQAAFGYFGHMWELYTFWGFIPVILGLYAAKNNMPLNIPLLSFGIIAAGAAGSVTGGYISLRAGNARVAATALLVSGICCLFSPLLFELPLSVFLFLMFLWGFTVSPDSPQFSTLAAGYAPPELRGTALTIYNSIGFSISTLSLLVTDRVFYSTGWFSGSNTFILLAAGALTGLPPMFRLIRSSK